jgi:hypothetical protein
LVWQKPLGTMLTALSLAKYRNVKKDIIITLFSHGRQSSYPLLSQQSVEMSSPIAHIVFHYN